MAYRAYRVLFVFVLVSAFGLQAIGQPAGRGVLGDWRLEGEIGEQKIESILSISPGEEGALRGEWISVWGVWNLKDVVADGSSLRFSQTGRLGNEAFTASFEGKVEAGRLEGVLTSERGEMKVAGRRLPMVLQAAGTWEMVVKAGEREYTGKLVVAGLPGGKVQATWQSATGEHTISNAAFSRGKLTFDLTSKIGDGTMESTFEGTVRGHELSGVFKSDRGEATAEGKRVGAAAVGRWDLVIGSDWERRAQVLRVNGDLSGLLGSTAVEKIEVDGNRVSFKTTQRFGEQTSEMSFAGRIEGGRLTGELTTPRGARAVEGLRRQPARVQGPPATAKPARSPDVIYVPTPQHVVDRMLELAKVTKDDVVYDLGCGDGRIVVTAALRHGARGIGYDINPQRVRESLQNVRDNNVGHLVRIEEKDIFTLDLSGASVIMLYLLPDLNVKLIPQLDKLKDGSRIVSHDFDMRGVEPDEVIRISDSEDSYGDHTIYLWTTPLKKTGVSSY